MENSDLMDSQNDVLSLRQIVKKAMGLISFLKLQFWKLLFFSMIGGGIGFWFAFIGKESYSAKLRFLMKESGGGSGLMSSLGSLGSLIGGAGGTTSPLDRTLAILGSEKIVGSALMKSITIDKVDDLAINHLIQIQGLRKAWEKDSLLAGVKFNKSSVSISNFSLSERKAYKSIVNVLIGINATMFVKSYDKKSGVFEIIINTKSEEFSIEFTKILFKELENFIYNQSINSSGKNITIIANKLDSIKAELNGVQNTLARNTDRTLGLLMQEDKVDQKKLMMKEQMLTIMYGEAQKNLETFKFINESINTGLEVLESPISPIQPMRRSKLKFTLVGFLFSGIVCFGFLVSKKWVKENL